MFLDQQLQCIGCDAASSFLRIDSNVRDEPCRLVGLWAFRTNNRDQIIVFKERKLFWWILVQDMFQPLVVHRAKFTVEDRIRIPGSVFFKVLLLEMTHVHKSYPVKLAQVLGVSKTLTSVSLQPAALMSSLSQSKIEVQMFSTLGLRLAKCSMSSLRFLWSRT